MLPSQLAPRIGVEMEKGSGQALLCYYVMLYDL